MLEERLAPLVKGNIELGSGLERAVYKGDKLGRFGFKNIHVYIKEHEVVVLELDETLTLSLKGVLLVGEQQGFVTVDMGAVKFLYNGADVMAPGIVEVSGDFEKGDIVWVRDETNKKPLSMGLALISARELELRKQGKAIRSFHHIGDFLWTAHL